jgi:hypothetical protein
LELAGWYQIGVQLDYNVVHLRTSLVQLFVLLLQNFEKVVQMIELKRFGGAHNGYPFTPLVPDSSIFTAIKPVRTTYSYKQAICQQFKHHSGTDKACKQGTTECMT